MKMPLQIAAGVGLAMIVLVFLFLLLGKTVSFGRSDSKTGTNFTLVSR